MPLSLPLAVPIDVGTSCLEVPVNEDLEAVAVKRTAVLCQLAPSTTGSVTDPS
jgi:hypothetical protein